MYTEYSVQSSNKMHGFLSVHSFLTLAIFVVTIMGHVSANWGPWGEYGSCSVTCGGGVRSRTRRCTSLRVKSCTGESVSYESCQIQVCPNVTVDLRSQQCLAFNRDNNLWISHYDMSSPCTLLCENQLGQVVKLRNTVLDGTPCDSHHSFGLCIAGVCKQVGCDHVIGSTKTVDDCLVCGGRGENCDTLSGSSADTTLKVGETTNMATFPFGTTKLEIRATTREPVNIELRSVDGNVFNLTKYLTEGSHNRTVDFSGALGVVKPIDKGFLLTARGPLIRTLHLKVQPSGTSLSIKYEYSIPLSRFVEKDPQLRFSWVDGIWTQCSAICGPGQQRRAVICIDRTTGKTVDKDLCSSKDMPALSRACQTRPCHQTLEEKYKWIPGTFSDCSSECGAGYQTQLMFCLQTEQNTKSAYVADTVCELHIGRKPVIRRACFGTETQCGQWITGDWSQCSVTCGQGRQTRSVACEKNYQEVDDDDDYGGDEIFPGNDQSLCSIDSRPASEQPCNPGTCNDSSDDEISIVTLIHDCQTSRYGCCSDNVTSAVGENQLGCNAPVNSDCRENTYGCCYDGVSSAKGPNKEGCPRLIGGCRGTRYGCCKDGVTAARGVNKEGCVEDNLTLKSRNACIDSPYGCCKDGTTAATGPNALGCPESKNVLIGGCRSTKYGCCSDGVTAAREDGCHFFDQAHCELERDPGSCSNYTIKYHFDMNFGVCRQFWYGGCEGNQNRFLTVEDCNNNCVRVDGPGVCRLPKITGVCKSHTNRFFYNHKTQQCEMFTYGGCKGNNNNFATIEDCQAKCGSSQQIKPTKPTVRQFACASFPCQNGFTCQDYQNGSYSCSCNPDWEKNCEAPPDYWCFSDSECSQSLKCIRQRKCQHGYCWIYARCSSVSKVFKCDKIDCPSRQVCVNDDSFQDGHFCIDATSYKRPTKVVLGCSLSEFGCCSDKQTPATGPYYQGCHKNCQTSKFGCCKDGVTSAEGYNYIGCEIDGSGELPCDKTVYGCCEDGITPAEGPRGQGCGDTVDSEDRVRETFTKKPTITEKCIAMNGNVRCKQFVIKWRYSTEKKECERHWWGGCEDNGNIFDSREHCEAICKSKTIKTETTFEPDIVSMCELSSERGPCRGNIQRYYYNPKEQSCILFAYGGCQGNENNFLTLEACQKECSGISVTARPDVINTQLPGPKIIVPEKNKVTLSVSGESKVKEGGEIKISCSASGTKQVNLKWYYNSIPASQVYGAQHRGKSTVSTTGYQKTVEIIIPQAQRNNSGTYTCRSSNGEIERIVITVHSSEVTSAPQSSDNIEVSLHGDSTTDVGSTISLTCRARGPSRPSRIEWYFNGRDINPEAGVLSINTYPDTVTRNAIISELAISKAQFSNEGTYFCKSKPYNFINKIKVSVRQGPALSGPVLIEADSYSTDKEVVCKLPAVTGNCKSAYTRWYYDHSDGQCKQFIYGGCGGNNNNFVTLNLCNNFCSSEEICLKPKLVGRCRAAIPRFYFDNETGRCREFIYGGCEGNLNNFDSHSACDSRCASYRRQIVGTDVKIIGTKNPTYQDICKLPQNKGQCSGLHIRWYFDDSQNRCIRFQYTGCGGNDNRFVSELECLDRCKHTVRPAPTTPPLPTIAHVADKSACAQPKNPGNCEQWVVTWYYDMSRRICHRFYYGGCGGNANRFPDRESCENLCSSERTTRHERITERPSQCVYTTFGCCSDGISTALDRLKSNCYESNVVQPSRDHTLVVVQPLGDAVLTCHLRGSEVVWYRDSFLLSSNRKTEIHTNGSLIFRRVTDDMAGTYSCRVLDRNNFPRLERFQVQISVPLDILPGPALMSFKPGSRAYLNCHTVGYPPPKITWEKNGVSLSNNHHLAVYGNGTLIIESVRAEDAGNYHCLADNGVSTKKTRTILLNIKETINVQIANHKGYYVEGETIQLSCTGNGFPSPSLEWVKDNRTLTTENNVQVDAGELTIKSASVEDSGTYRCVAKNNNNKAEAITTVQIKLQGPMIQCQDKLSRTRCMSIVRAHLCEIRYFYSSCCHSCEKVNRRPK